MKVAIVSQPFDSVLPPGQNSIGIWSYEVARRLAAHADVTVLIKALPAVRQAGHGSVVQHEDVTYRVVRALPNRLWAKLGEVVDRRLRRRHPFYASRLYHVDFALGAAVGLRRGGFDVVHIHNFVSFVPLLRRLNPRAKLVLHMSGEWLSQLDRDLVDRRLQQVDTVFGSSDHITGLVRARFPHHAHKCHTVYNGVDVSAFAPAADRPASDRETIVFVGRISPEKGVHDLIEAFTILAERRPDARLVLVGPADVIPLEFIVGVSDDEEVRRLARFYDQDYLTTLRSLVPAHLQDRVEFTGPMSHEAVVDRVAGAAVLANPSYSESFGMSLVEAMASEVPVVATRVGGMKEIVVDGVTGRLVERGDVNGLAAALDEVLDDPDRRRGMGRAGRQRVIERFSWEVVTAAARERYEQLLASP